MASQVVLVIKNVPANAGDAKHKTGFNPWVERSPGEANPLATHSTILAWRIPWTEEPGGHSPWGCKESDITEHTHTQGRPSPCTDLGLDF